MKRDIIKNLISFEEVKKYEDYGTEFYAVGDNGNWYDASFNRKINVMFFCIPSTVEVIGYLRKVG